MTFKESDIVKLTAAFCEKYKEYKEEAERLRGHIFHVNEENKTVNIRWVWFDGVQRVNATEPMENVEIVTDN